MYNYVDLKETENALKAADLFFNISDNPIFNFNDYRYYGRALKEAKKFQLAAEQYQKAYKLDTTKVDLWKDVSDMYNEIDSFSNAISAYNTYLSKIPEKQKNDADILVGFAKLYYSLGINKTTTALISKSSLLKSDSIFAIVVALEPEVYRGNFWRARVNSALDPETTQGLAKPFYDKTVAMVEQKNDIRFNSILIECYSYLGYYTLLQKDYTTSLAYWNKILVMDPTNVTAQKAIAGIQAPKKKK